MGGKRSTFDYCCFAHNTPTLPTLLLTALLTVLPENSLKPFFSVKVAAAHS